LKKKKPAIAPTITPPEAIIKDEESKMKKYESLSSYMLITAYSIYFRIITLLNGLLFSD